PPTGTVQFQIDRQNAGSALTVSTFGGVTSASFSSASLPAGTHAVTARYSGDGSFGGSVGSLSGGQTVKQANTSTAVISSANPSMYGQSVNLTATVTINGVSGAPVI